jgi:hypothetical protein
MSQIAIATRAAPGQLTNKSGNTTRPKTAAILFAMRIAPFSLLLAPIRAMSGAYHPIC